MLLLMLWAAVSDLLSRSDRYWTHWLGLVLSVLTTLISIVFGMFYWLSWT